MMQAMQPSATPADLDRALEAALHHGPSYPARGMQLSSHLPMVLTALWRLGAPAAALQAQLDLWAPRLPAAGPVPTQPPLADLLPRLLEAPETAAFHGAIRLAYALEAGHAGEIEAALASWQGAARSLGPLPDMAPGTRPLREVIDGVRADARLAMLPRQGTSIMSDMAVAAALPGFAAHLPLPRLSLDALAEAALAVYLATRDFTALHLVTGLHAARVLLRAVPGLDEARLLQRLWRAWLAAYVSIGRPAPAWAVVHAGEAGEGDWQRALPAVFASGDDHRIKLADSAREEWRLRGWPGYALCLQG